MTFSCRQVWFRELWLNLRYIAVGLVNTAVGIVVIALFMALGVHPVLSNVLGYACGLATAFLGTRIFVFSSRQPIRRQSGKFMISFILSYGLNLSVLYVCYAGLLLDPFLSQLISMAAYSLSMYALQRIWVFGRPADPQDLNTPAPKV